MTDRCGDMVKQMQGVSNRRGVLTTGISQNIVFQKSDTLDVGLRSNLQEKLLAQTSDHLVEVEKNITDASKTIKSQGTSLYNMKELVDGTGHNVN
jgi:hypothetical protein